MLKITISCTICTLVLCVLVADVLCNVPDPYSVLGVSRRASQREIKRTYKKLAREWHPDKNNEPNAQEKFIQIQQAYEIVGDEDKRRQYDLHGIVDDGGQQRSQQGGYQTFNFGGFNFKFQNQNSGFRQSHRVTLSKYDDVIAPQSYHKPWLLLVIANWCFNCVRVEEVWNELLSDFEEMGIGMGILNADYDYNLARKIGAYRWPSIFGIVDERVTSYGDNHIGKDNLKHFVQQILPAHLVSTVTDNNSDEFLSTWRRDNKPRSLLFSRRSGPSLLYQLAALQFRQQIKLGFARLGGRDTDDLVFKYAVNEREPTLLIFKENTENYAEKFEANSLLGSNLRDTLSSQKYLHVPRLSSQEVYEDLCKETPLFQTKSLCVILITSEGATHDYQESFRQVYLETTSWPEETNFVYLYRDRQRAFMSALGKDENVPNYRLSVAILWRRNGQKAKYGWLPGGWEGNNISGNKKRIRTHLQELVTNKNLLIKQVELPKLNDENAPHWMLQVFKDVWQKIVGYLVSLKDSLFSGSVNEASVAVGVICIYILAFFLAFASILGSKGREPWEQDRQRQQRDPHHRHGNNWEHYDDAHRATNLSPDGAMRRRTPGPDISKYRHIELVELDPANYKELILDSRQSGMMLLLLVDSSCQARLIDRFKQEAYSHLSSPQFQQPVYIDIDNYPEWFATLLANSTHPEPDSISTAPGTVLALRPAKHYFSLYHPLYSISSSNSPNQLDAGFIGLDSSSDESDGEINEVRRVDPLNGLRMWLDRLVDGSLKRLSVANWPYL
ncbi:dnaJ homolog subfamily C member 16-like isoform X1 [Amphiura filiformis]|uniref:dnaJ homolog subfamily C member 16-like isoform X1 n=1 Tax=Amphiura filiformis TaxID=82378 RepID=UPI003B22471A